MRSWAMVGSVTRYPWIDYTSKTLNNRRLEKTGRSLYIYLYLLILCTLQDAYPTNSNYHMFIVCTGTEN